MSYIEKIDKNRIPQHIAIMGMGDGLNSGEKNELTVTRQAQKRYIKLSRMLHVWGSNI